MGSDYDGVHSTTTYLTDMIAAEKDTMEIESKFGHCARKKCTEPKIAIQAVL
jgi:hypothetical protein